MLRRFCCRSVFVLSSERLAAIGGSRSARNDAKKGRSWRASRRARQSALDRPNVWDTIARVSPNLECQCVSWAQIPRWFRCCGNLRNLRIEIFRWAESHCGLWQIETFGCSGGTLGCCDDRPLFPTGNARHLVGPAQIRNLA